MKKFIYISLFSLIFSSLYGQENVSGSLNFEGVDRPYIVHLPPQYDGTTALPLVFNLHGAGSNKEQQQFYAQMDPVSNANGFIVCYPDGIDNVWNVSFQGGSTADDVGYINALIDRLHQDYNIDKTRVYSCGMSNGGYLSYKLACELGDRICAIASVTGSMVPIEFSNCSPSRAVPVMQMHGTEDPTVAYGGSAFATDQDVLMAWWANNNGCDEEPSFEEIEDIDPNDGCTAERYVWSNCTDGADVEFYKIIDGEHTWPGAPLLIGVTNKDIDGSEEIWRFFDQFDLPSAASVSNTDIQNDVQIQISPNPFVDEIRIQGNDLESIRIMDAQGKLIQSYSNMNDLEINASNWETGVYFISIQNKSGNISRKVVKH